MVCLTKKLPAVEGTPCGKGRICLQGKCVDKTRKRHYSVRHEDGGKIWCLSRETNQKLDHFYSSQTDILTLQVLQCETRQKKAES